MVKILIVEDEVDLREEIVDELRYNGYDVREANNGQEAFELITNDTPDVIISDISMPKMDGYELFEKIQKTSKEFAAIPFVFLTALVSRDDEIKGRRLGVTNYLRKPIDFDVLIATIQSLHNARERMDAHVESKLQKTLNFLISATAKDNDPEIEALIENYDSLSKLARQPIQSIQCLNQAQFKIQTPEQASNVANTLSHLCPEPESAIIGFIEVFMNGIEHGNLEIGYEKKSILLEEKQLEIETAKRLQDDKYKDRFVEIDYRRTDTQLLFNIKDQGEGFNWRQYSEFSPELMLAKHGRGVAIALHLAFPSLTYNDKGNEVSIVVDIE
ncbi:putative Response regulator [Candidatus Terasakiella magnetica]|uniref:Putative Response regulator n=1 Tax=Candidatus Terasakiella magnetica TaxID=1867952 RepID=A0A1C3RE46_9PROT|nr:response regulator [Candidatus Terasakiella magnetica]SCA55535.1 putative Response regulator [Candidatus Terasakiella magnetica]